MAGHLEVRIRRRDRRSTEDDLVAAASAVFAQRGYENATTRSIAEAAGCSEALIQRYFNGKEGLLLAVLNRTGYDPRDRFFDRPLCASLVDEAREMLSHAMLAFAERSGKMRIVLSRVLVDPTFLADFQRISARRHIKSRLRKRLARYVGVGMIDPVADLDMATEYLMCLIFQLGFVHRELHQSKPAEIHRMIEAFAGFFARGIAPIQSPARKSKK